VGVPGCAALVHVAPGLTKTHTARHCGVVTRVLDELDKMEVVQADGMMTAAENDAPRLRT
jgi:hypothetical protein